VGIKGGFYAGYFSRFTFRITKLSMFAFKIASLAVLLVAVVNASAADVAARQEQGFACT
jgi:intracellular sulfur oxidation DsrE/DsrF family protein